MQEARQLVESYESNLPLESRRATGSVYTPESLVDLILDLSGFEAQSPIEKSKLLDPACGGGVFLDRAICRLADRLTHLGLDLATKSGAEIFAGTVEQNLFGVDKDPQACSLALKIVEARVRSRTGGIELPQEFFARNIDCRDYLEGSGPDLFSEDSREPFSFIVGNPPYVTTSRLSAADKRRYRDRFQSAHGRIDLYLLFFERSLELLEQGGVLAFVTPDKLLTSESASRTRQLIREVASVKSVTRFESHRVFRHAALVPCITVLARGKSQGEEIVEVGLCPQQQIPPKAQIAKSWKARLPSKSQDAWYLLQASMSRILDRLQNGNPSLGQVTDRISAGIATGRDTIFTVDKSLAKKLEPELLNRAVRGRDIRRFDIQDSGLHLIVPFSSDDRDQVDLVDLGAYPLVREYLQDHKAELESRHCVRRWNKSWFDIHDPWTFNLTRTPKVLFPDLARTNRFVFDPGHLCPLHSAYYLTSSTMDLEYLAAVLNSKPVEFFTHLVAPTAKDAFRRYRRQFLVDVPVPVLGREDRQEIVKAARARAYEELDSRAAWAYGLSPSQVSTIEKHLRAESWRG